MKRTCLTHLLVAVIASISAFSAQAQEIGRVEDTQANGTSYHFYARPGDATVQVEFVGPASSGVYEVSSQTDLGMLLVLTGGLSIPPKQAGMSQEIVIRLYREGSGPQRAVAYEAPLESFLRETGNYPALRDGDLVILEVTTRQRFGWRDSLSITTAAAAVLLLVERAIFLF